MSLDRDVFARPRTTTRRWRSRVERGEVSGRLTADEHKQLDDALTRMQQDPALRAYLLAWDRDHSN